MNFIKKRIKGPKKTATHHDDDDLDPNEFHVPGVPPGKGAPEGWVPYDQRVDEESEEWLAFKRLTQRVSDTLQKTEENLKEIVATSVISGDSKNIEEVHLDTEDIGDGLHLNELPTTSSSTTRVKPGRPPPPRPAPPRPPQPAQGGGTAVTTSQDPFENSSQDFSSFDFASEPREKSQKPVPGPGQLAPDRLEFDLHSEFGFSGHSPARTPILPPSTGSLFLDHEADPYTEPEEDDPFDTSFAAHVTHTVNERSTKATGDLALLGRALSIPIDSIKGIISVEQLLRDSSSSSHHYDDDDPFIVKENGEDPFIVKESGNDHKQHISPDMDPFDSFLQGPPVAGMGRSKSPNPFITDDDAGEEPGDSLHSSNPFASAGAGGDTESFFGGHTAPNPFAEIMQQQANIASSSDLLGMSFAEQQHQSAAPSMTAHHEDNNMMDDFFGSSTTAMPPQPRKNSNPFCTFVLPLSEAKNELFSIDLLGGDHQEENLPQPFPAAITKPAGGPPPKPPPPKLPAPISNNIASSLAFGDDMNGDFMSTNTTSQQPPTTQSSFPSATPDFGVDPFGSSADVLPLTGAKVLGAFGLDSDVKIEPFPSAQDLVSPPKASTADSSRRSSRPSKPDIFDAELRNLESSLGNFGHDDILPPVTASIDVFSSLLTGPSTDVTMTTAALTTSMAGGGGKTMPPARPPPPSASPAKTAPPSRPPPPSVAITNAPPEPPPPTFETWDAFDSKDEPESTSTSKMEDSQFFNAFDGAAPASARPPRPPSILCASQDSTPSDPFGGGGMTIDSTDIMHPDEKVEFEPIPVALQKLVNNSSGFDIFDNHQEPEEGSGGAAAGGSDASAPSTVDLFSSFNTVDDQLQPRKSSLSQQLPPPLQSSTATDFPRPPSIDGLDAFGSSSAADISDDAPVVAAPSGFDASFTDDAAPSSSTGFGLMSPTLPTVSSPIMEATVVPMSRLGAGPAAVATDTVPFTDSDTFDAFDAKFQSTHSHGGAFEDNDCNPFADNDCSNLSSGGGAPTLGFSNTGNDTAEGFGAADEFDPFFAIKEVPAAPKPSPARFYTKSSAAPESPDSDDDEASGPDFSVFIRPKMRDKDTAAPTSLGPIPILAPPPKSPMRSPPGSHTSPTPRFNPFDKDATVEDPLESFLFDGGATREADSGEARTPPQSLPGVGGETGKLETAGSQDESPGSPLFDLDDTEPLDDFHPKYPEDGWDLMLRQPSKKKLTGQRFWKKVFVTLSDNGVLHLYNKKDDKDAFQELPLQACYSLSEVSTQQYDNYGKIFTVKLQYVFYRERVGVRPGQISKVAHGQITSLGQLAKLGLPLEHAPQVSQLLKLGTQNYVDLKPFVRELEDTLFRLTVHRDRALTYKTEEVQVTVIDELRAEVGPAGIVRQQLARVRVFLLAFITSMPDVELGLNDITKQGKEVVGRHDIIPVITEEWIRLEKVEFHSCVMVDEFEKSRTIKFHPPDACFFELLRFRIRPPRNRELPLQVKTTMSLIGSRVEIRADVLVPGCISRKHGQIPCEDVAIRFPIPECWIYLFRVEKHFRYGSVKSAARKPGKIKGLDRIMGGGLSMEPSLIEVSTGQAKYEHHHKSIVWRIPRLPKDGQGAYTTQLFVCRMELTSYDQIPEEFSKFVYVEFHMPATTVSHTTVRSVSVTNPNPPEKYVKYLARHEYRTEIEMVTITSECEYNTATSVGANAGAAASSATNASPVPSQ